MLYITRKLSENRKTDSKWLSLATTTMDGGSAGFAGAKNLSVSFLGQPSRIILLLPLLCFAINVATAKTPARHQVSFYIQEYGQSLPDSNPQIIKTYEVFNKVRDVADKNSKRLPKLVVINSQTEPWVIALPDGHIVLSNHAINLCFRHTENPEACLAFVLGHELAHLANDDFWHYEVYSILDSNSQSRQLASFLKQHESAKAKEIAADDKGFVYAVLAGFPAQLLFSTNSQAKHGNFFDHWVKQASSQISNLQASNQNRALLLQQRLQQIQQKLIFFEFGMRLSQFDYCDDAIYFLREFLLVYPGREVMSNLGFCYLQMARREMGAERTFLYWMPLLLDVETRANMSTRNSQQPQLKNLKQMASNTASGYLDQAVEHLLQAIAADSTYLPAHLNLAIAYLYLGKPHHTRAIITEALKIHAENEQLLILDALALYEQNEAGIDLWAIAIERLEKLANKPSASTSVYYNLARLNAMRPRLPQARFFWNKLANNLDELPTPIKTIVCQEQTRLAIPVCLKSTAQTDLSIESWQWPLPPNNFARVNSQFKQQYLSQWDSVKFNWFQDKLHGNIYRSPEHKAEILVLDDFVQMQVIKQEIPFNLERIKQQCPNNLRHRKVLQGNIWSCKRWAVLIQGEVIKEVWLISN